MTVTIDRLLHQAHLFEDPEAYEAGVRDAVEALRALADSPSTGGGDRAAAAERLGDPDRTSTELRFPPELVVRESTAPPPPGVAAAEPAAEASEESAPS